MADYKEVASNFGRGLLDLGEAFYDMTGSALTGTGNALYHISQRKVDARSFFNSNITRWAAIAGMAWLAYVNAPIGCHSKHETQAQTTQIQVLEKRVADLKTELNSKRSCAVLSQDNPAYLFNKDAKQ